MEQRRKQTQRIPNRERCPERSFRWGEGETAIDDQGDAGDHDAEDGVDDEAESAGAVGTIVASFTHEQGEGQEYSITDSGHI